MIAIHDPIPFAAYNAFQRVFQNVPLVAAHHDVSSKLDSFSKVRCLIEIKR